MGKKGDLNKLRREGKIPAILYGRGPSATPIYVSKEDVDAILRQAQSGSLPTTLFELQCDGKTEKALIKEIQYHRTNYGIEHIDFAAVSDDKPVSVNVPIQLAGIGECVGVKLGGFVRHVIRNLKVSCMLKDVPKEFVLDVRDMQIAQTKRLSDLSLPEGVRPMAKMNEVAVVIAKKA